MNLTLLYGIIQSQRLVTRLVRSRLRVTKRKSSLTRQAELRNFKRNPEQTRLHHVNADLCFVTVNRYRGLPTLSVLRRNSHPHYAVLKFNLLRSLFSVPLRVAIGNRNSVITVFNHRQFNRNTKGLFTTVAALMNFVTVNSNGHLILSPLSTNSTVTIIIRTTGRHTRRVTVHVRSFATRLAPSGATRIRHLSTTLSLQDRVFLRGRVLPNAKRVDTRFRNIRVRSFNRRSTRNHHSNDTRKFTIGFITMVANIIVTDGQLRLLYDLQVNSSDVALRTLDRRKTISIRSAPAFNTRHRNRNTIDHNHLYNLATTSRLNKNRLGRTYQHRRHRYNTSNSTFRHRNLSLNRLCSTAGNIR